MADILSTLATLLQGGQLPVVRPAAQGGSINVPLPRPNPMRVEPRQTGVQAERVRNGAPPVRGQSQSVDAPNTMATTPAPLAKYGPGLLSGVKLPSLSGETDLGSALRSVAAGMTNADPRADDLGQAAGAFLGSSVYGDQRREQQQSRAKQEAASAQLGAAIDAMADLTPEQKAAAKASPEIAATIIKSRFGKDENVTPLITNFRFAQKEDGYTGSFQDWVAEVSAKESGGAEYGLNPVYGKDAEGNPIIGQLAKDGTFRQTELPAGFKLTPGVQKVDLGTHWGILDRDGRVTATIPKDVAGEEQAKTTGKAAGEAAAQIPAMRGMAGMISDQIASIKNDPYLPRMLGPIDSRLPNASTDAARVQAKLDQLQGGAFLQARQMLKGGGAITDYEGSKAEAAFARLNTAQSEEDFKQALDDFDAAVQAGIKKLEAQAGQGGSAPAATPSPPAQPTAAPDPLGIR